MQTFGLFLTISIKASYAALRKLCWLPSGLKCRKCQHFHHQFTSVCWSINTREASTVLRFMEMDYLLPTFSWHN